MILESKINKKIKQLSKLSQYKDKSEDDLRHFAVDSLKKQERADAYSFRGVGYFDTKTKNIAKKIFEDFREKYTIDSQSDLELLEERIYLQYLNDVYKEGMVKAIKKAKESKSFNVIDLVDRDSEKAYQDRLKEIQNLDKLLGLRRKKESSPLNLWDDFKQRVQREYEQSGAEHITKCKHCQQFNHHLFKVKDYETYPYSMLEGSYLYNKGLMKIIDGALDGMSKEERMKFIANEVWQQPRIDYVKICYDKIYLKRKKLKEIEEKSL